MLIYFLFFGNIISAMMSSYSPGKKVGMPQVPDVISRNQHVFSSDDGFPPPPPSVFFPPERGEFI